MTSHRTLRSALSRSAAGAAVAVAAFAAAPAAAAPESWVIDQTHTHILFFVDHLGFSAVQGEFLAFEGDLTLDRETPANSSVSVTIDVASLDSGHGPRDAHLLNEDFFAAETHPTMTFDSTTVTLTGDDTAEVVGDLTILGETREVVLDVTLNQLGPNPFANQLTTAGFSAETTILRSDFGMEFGVPLIGDEITIRIETEASPAEELASR